jgi:hypothetical protein
MPPGPRGPGPYGTAPYKSITRGPSPAQPLISASLPRGLRFVCYLGRNLICGGDRRRSRVRSQKRPVCGGIRARPGYSSAVTCYDWSRNAACLILPAAGKYSCSTH